VTGSTIQEVMLRAAQPKKRCCRQHNSLSALVASLTHPGARVALFLGLCDDVSITDEVKSLWSTRSAQMVCCRSQFFGWTGLPYRGGCSAVLIQKVVAMLAEIFMVRSEAKARLVEEVFPSSKSSFIPFNPKSQFAFKDKEPKGAQPPGEEWPVGAAS
jgi:hypothetical protein